MYTVALLILVGIVADFATGLVYENASFLKRVPVLKDLLIGQAAIATLLVWMFDVSVFAAFGASPVAPWVEIIGSGIAVAGFTRFTDSALGYLERR